MGLCNTQSPRQVSVDRVDKARERNGISCIVCIILISDATCPSEQVDHVCHSATLSSLPSIATEVVQRVVPTCIHNFIAILTTSYHSRGLAASRCCFYVPLFLRLRYSTRPDTLAPPRHAFRVSHGADRNYHLRSASTATLLAIVRLSSTFIAYSIMDKSRSRTCLSLLHPSCEVIRSSACQIMSPESPPTVQE